MVRVVTVGQDSLGRDELFEGTLARLDQTAAFQPDIACLPEVFSRRPPEPLPGPTSERLAQWARAHRAYVVFGIKTRIADRVYNSAVLLDRQGRIAGRYDKMHPTEGELEGGVHPGVTDPPVFETDFGTIGIQICFDVNWWDGWKRLREKGAKIVFFPAAYPAARHVSAIALMNQFYVVSSAMTRPSRIYDITGRELASTGHFQEWAGAVLPIGKRLFEIDRHVAKVRQIQKKYGSRVDVTWYHDDDWFTLASLDPALSVDQVIAEFGLTPLRDYIAESGAAIDKVRVRAPQHNEVKR